MPKGTPRTRTDAADALPLVSSKRGKYQELERCALDAQVHADLLEYVEFVKEADGEEPKIGGIVSAALERLFEADAAFPKWRGAKRSRARLGGKGMNSTAPVVAATTTANGTGNSKAARVGEG